MNINNFKIKDKKEQKKIEKKLENFKLEKVLSLWYGVVSSSKATIVGSKN